MPLQEYSQNSIVYSSQPPYQWQQVACSKKRSRNHEEPGPSKKKEYWLGNPVTVNNRYSALAEEETMEGDSSNTEPKPPPIFVSGAKNIKPLVELLNTIAQHNYILKTLYNNQVKVQPLESSTYTTIIKALAE
jgi:hypothetical protein